jgi:hypothetical protein
MLHAWIPDWSTRSPMLDPLRGWAATLPGDRWPTLAELQALFDAAGIANERGKALTLVPHEKRRGGYEARIYREGELQIRPNNWHDFLNALAWLAFPRTKAALNVRHYHEQSRQRTAGARNRGPVQDALTLFDEGGVIVAASDAGLLAMLEGFAWKDLFWVNRVRVSQHMHFVMFGHALCEKALAPFAGITGRGLLLRVDDTFHALAACAKAEHLDALAAAVVSDPARFTSTRELAPVPVLGVPGWCTENQREAYYEDEDYFRPGRGSRGAISRRCRQ